MTNGGEIVPAVQTQPQDAELVHQPQKLIRIGAMVRQMLEEVRRAPLDEEGRRMLRAIHERSLGELKGILSPELVNELNEMTIPFGDDVPTESQLRVAQAQLMGWLEGLFHGIQAALFSQQVQAQQQLGELQRGPQQPGPDRGAYL